MNANIVFLTPLTFLQIQETKTTIVEDNLKNESSPKNNTNKMELDLVSPPLLYKELCICPSTLSQSLCL